MADNSASNKRIAKNSLFLSIRMVFVLGITLYTTRAVLSVLGVEDYGIYNVVCGFVSMFSFLNTSMSNGIQRFYNYELGKNRKEAVQNVYCTAIIIQLLLSVIIVILTETLGIWYLNNKMVIPDERMVAASCTFHFSVISFIFVIMQVPYVAAIMANERMDFYAFVSVIDACLKLVIVFAIPLFGYDDLIVYGILWMFVCIIDFFVYFFYCKRKFKELTFSYKVEKDLFRTMLGFSGWNVFGSFSHMMKEQGINLVLNLFGGPVINAARGVAVQVNSGIQNFVNNITVPVRPQVVQSYARGEIQRTMSLTYSVSKFSCYFLYMLGLPVMLEITYILNIWLGVNIPDYTETFVVIIIITSFLNNLNAPISNVVHATGIMKKYQIYSAFVVLSAVPMAYLVLTLGASPEYALIMVLLSMIAAQVVALYILKSIIDYSIVEYIKKVVIPIIFVVLTTFWIPFIPHILLESGFARLIIVFGISVVVIVFTVFILGLNKAEKEIVKTLLRKITNKIIR